MITPDWSMITKGRRLGGVAIMIAVGLSAIGCGADADPLRSETVVAPEVVVGAPESAEGEVVAALYAGALRAQGLTVAVHPSGARDDALPALRDGRLDLMPDEVGTLLGALDPDQSASTIGEIEAQLPRALGPELTMITPAPASAQTSYVITKTLADRSRVSRLDQLADLDQKVVVGGPATLSQSKEGPAALTGVYGVQVAAYRPYDDSTALVRDLDSGQVSVGAFAGTDPALAGKAYVRLADPDAIVLPENVTAIAGPELSGRPTAVGAIESVHRALTTEELTTLLAQVGEAQRVDQVAGDWLRAKGLG